MKNVAVRPHTNHYRPRLLIALSFGLLSLLGALFYCSRISFHSGSNSLQFWFAPEEDDDFSQSSFPDFQMYGQRVKVLREKEVPLGLHFSALLLHR
jgi:hypothetical protein